MRELNVGERLASAVCVGLLLPLWLVGALLPGAGQGIDRVVRGEARRAITGVV